MPLTHLVTVNLRPGVQSISVQYQVADSGIWITWNEGQRLIQGATVKFTVTTYPNFTLTEWEAYYADEYDDTVNLSLSPVSGQSAWTFTMPPADVYIRCEASPSQTTPTDFPYIMSSSSYSDGAIYIHDTDYSVKITNKTSPSSLGHAIAEMYSLWGITINNVILPSSVLSHTGFIYFVMILDGNQATWNFYLFSPENDFTGRSVSPPYTNFNNSGLSCTRVGALTNMTVLSGNTLDLSHGVTIGTESNGVFRVGWFRYDEAGGMGISGSNAVYEIIQNTTYSSIRYMFSPENSGEVDASAPSEFVHGTTEFTFKWRIKSGYSLRRITPFAVGEGPLEDDVLYSSAYDGETRTYTVTVQQIPNWAKGARVLIECINHNDPNVGGNSGTGGGDGTFDETSDPIPLEPMPSISAADAGLITLFRPTLAELKQLGAYLWTNIDDFIDNMKKMFSNPMDTLIALNIIPGLPPVGSARNIRLGVWDTNITMSPVLSQWYEINFGAVKIGEFWGSALDYSPNTKVHAMLPFIGSAQLDTDDIMGKTLSLVYRIDLLSGHLVAVIMVDDDILYQFTGECAVAVPLTGADWSRVYGAIAGVIGTTAIGAAGVAAAGASVGVASGAARVGAINAAIQAGREFRRSGIDAKGVAGVRAMRQGMIDAMHEALDSSGSIARESHGVASALKAGVAAHAANNVVGQVMSGKVAVQHSGTISGSAGLLGCRRPYIYIEYPNQSLPKDYKHYYGYPSNMTANLGGLKGFTQCYQVLLNGFAGTDGEHAELLEALKEGVYL